MSTTIGQLVDRTFREYLEPADNVESFSILASGISDSARSRYRVNVFYKLKCYK